MTYDENFAQELAEIRASIKAVNERYDELALKREEVVAAIEEIDDLQIVVLNKTTEIRQRLKRAL